MGGRRRKSLLLLLVALGLAVVAAIVVIAMSGETESDEPEQRALDLEGGVELTLQARPTAEAQEVTSEVMDRTVEMIRSGCETVGISEIEVSRRGEDQISVGIPVSTDVDAVIECATEPARLDFYDWQGNLVGPAMEMDPRTGTDADPTEVRRQVTQLWNEAGRPIGQDFNASWIAQGAEPTLWHAVDLAAKQERDENCENCAYGDRFYLFEEAAPHKLISGPAATEEDLYVDQDGGRIPQEGIVKKVPQGVVVVRELPIDADGKTVRINDDGPRKNAQGAKADPAGYFVIKDNSALSSSDLEDPQQDLDQLNQPNVTFGFTDDGRSAFQELTRTIARNGQAQEAGVSNPDQAAALSGNFAIVLDGQVVSRPIINFVDNPDGIDGGQGAQVAGGFTIGEAQRLAGYLQRGALPVDLTVTRQSKVPEE